MTTFPLSVWEQSMVQTAQEMLFMEVTAILVQNEKYISFFLTVSTM